jgi:hypothetical protein
MTKTSIHPSQLAVLPANPTVDQAVAYMQTSMDIIDWNLKRRRVKMAVGQLAWLNNYVVSNDSYVSRIDAQGLIIKVLGKPATSSAHKPFKYKQKA